VLRWRYRQARRENDHGPISKTVLAQFWSANPSNPLDDLKAAQSLVSGACGLTANLIVMGRLAGDAFELDRNVLESFRVLVVVP
jgi:hypothetical protein